MPKRITAWDGCWWRRETCPAASLEIRRAVELAPQSPQYHTNLGVVLSTGDKAEAVRQFRKALAIDPSFCLAEYNLGAALQQQNGMLKRPLNI